ncbi:ADP compounds hydrolase NudE [Plasticicumulans sp.]|uniref:ADP compounds hydrolase NudE n=1 Tax=Plasticicumulans sp. TaxID=2307179 RepID=UPI000F9A2D7B|nr:ADP compounds hydrolase NudE [Plasticicumulans sp.]MBS0603254.1 ADP compounds hydrolase NudE [Pseudomonadota bacterium]RTK97514.1 MAG: ADP compounds hydrolase NudE [Xanthomonadales bacterium]HMV38109.1 ADP compounds hydrolase NudE [Plasticicumulans sp.]HMW28555.1 ADP compounds hydrolase NudE [Plasticicumulans sp.]HMW41916.1 ADP compounds hydrolase NudE [Plasticicumulans sp.]
MRPLPEILATETVARSRLFRVEKVDLRFANGVEVEFERVPSGGHGSVLIVPMLDADTCLLVREYAAGTHRYELGCPKGVVEAGEDPLAAANREIMEEVGHGARRLTLLRSATIAPGYFAHVTHLVLAEDLYPETRPGDEPEAIEVVPWRLSELDALLARPDFTEARSIAALFLARAALAAAR